MRPSDFPAHLHYARVRLGLHGDRGRLLRCEGPRGMYWKVKTDSGRWAWPDPIMHDTEGRYVCRCRECELEFRSEKVNEVICPVCDAHLDELDRRREGTDRGALKRIAWREEHGAKS